MLLLCIASLITSVALAVWWWRRGGPLAMAFVAVGAVEAAWSLGHALEILSSTFEGKRFWDSLQNLPWGGLGLIGFVVGGSMSSSRTFRALTAIASGALLAATLALATEPLHEALHPTARLVGSPPGLTYDFVWVDAVVGLLSASGRFVCGALLLIRWTGANPLIQRRSVVLAAAVAMPTVVGTVLSATGLRIDGDRDVSSIGFLVGALITVVGMRRPWTVVTPLGHAAVLSRLTDAVLVIDEERRIADANPSAERLLADGDSLLGAPVATALASWPDVLALVGSTQPVNAEARSDESGFDVSWTPLVGLDGVVLGGALMLRDATERIAARRRLESRVAEETANLRRAVSGRQSAEFALALSEGRFRTMFDQAIQLTGLLDREGRILAANQAALRMIGRRLEDVVGSPFWETPWWAHDAAVKERVRAGVAKARAGEVVRFQTEHVDTAGAVRRIDFSLSPVRDSEGQVVEIIPEGRDVTELYEERERADRLLSRLRQSQKLESLGRLAGGVAHDFNNILTVILGNAEVLAAGAPPALRGSVDEIEHAARAASDITKQLLTFSRERPHSAGGVDLGELIRAQGALLRRLVRENIRIEQVFDDDLWGVRGDRVELQQVLLNLTVNAQDAMPDGGTLTIRASNRLRREQDAPGAPESPFVVLEVRDTGVGMDERELSQIFEPFFTTKPEGGGTGLGLSMVHGVVHAAGGVIEVSSKRGEGTTFTLYFPRAEQIAPVVDVAARPVTRGTATIVVVEDMLQLRDVIRRMLERGGFKVHAFASPDDLLEAAATIAPAPELLLSDIVLPRMNGPTIAGLMKSRWPELRVVLMSGYAPADGTASAGLDDVTFLRKPFTPSELVARITQVLEAPLPTARTPAPGLDRAAHG
jgi:PAS domain S-box-containing protein